MSTPQPSKGPDKSQSKSNVWLVVIIILVVGAILWPILRRDETPAGTEGTPLDETATTTTLLDESIGGEDGFSVVGVKPTTNQTASVGTAASETLTLRAYFGNRRLDPQGLKCDTVYPVFRTVPETTAVGRAALAELLKGPTPAEAAAGVVSAINPGVKLQNLTIINGVAYVDFNQALVAEVGGTCLVTAIRAQIIETLKQFQTVKSVLISINGVSVGILEP